MENQTKEVIPTWRRWLTGFIVTGFILSIAQKNHIDRSQFDQTIILMVAISCGVIYYRVKERIHGKEWLRIVGTFFALEIIAAIAIGALTAIIR